MSKVNKICGVFQIYAELISVLVHTLTHFKQLAMYKGSRLRELTKKERGLGAQLSREMFQKNKGIERYYKDGVNLTVTQLEKIAIFTGKSVEYFLDYKRPANADSSTNPHVYGDNNIVNSPNANDAIEKIEHLNRVIKLQEEIIKSDKELISSKDVIISTLKERISDQLKLIKELGVDK